MATVTNRKQRKPTFIEEARRKQILEIAIQEIEKRGYRETTIQDIAKEAGISKGVIYYHFNTREELLSAIWSALIEELFDYRRQRVERHETAQGRLRSYAKAHFEFVKINYNKFIALFAMGFDLTPVANQSHPWSREINERCFGYLSDILERGRQNGEFGQFSVAKVVPIIQGALDGLILQWVATPDLVDFSGCREVLMDIIERYTAPTES
jgi:TetR/AcrR family transcriptional regulator, fatty acid metabolism regulator protein